MRSIKFNLFSALLWAVTAGLFFLENQSEIVWIPACLASAAFLTRAVLMARKIRKNQSEKEKTMDNSSD